MLARCCAQVMWGALGGGTCIVSGEVEDKAARYGTVAGVCVDDVIVASFCVGGLPSRIKEEICEHMYKGTVLSTVCVLVNTATRQLSLLAIPDTKFCVGTNLRVGKNNFSAQN